MRTAKITGMTATIAWAVGVAAFMVLLLTEPNTRITLPYFFEALAVYGAYVAVIVLPVALVVVAPLVAFLPKRSAAFHPAVSPLVGSLAGLAGTYLFFVAISREPLDTSDLQHSIPWLFAGIAALGGAISGYACARQIRATVAHFK